MDVKGERRKFKDHTIIHLHTNQPFDIDDRTQRRKMEIMCVDNGTKKKKKKRKRTEIEDLIFVLLLQTRGNDWHN